MVEQQPLTIVSRLYRSLGQEEIDAANRVLNSGVLSAFIGAAGEGFLGGPEIQALEREASLLFSVKHVVSVNSWTSGLVASVGAIGVEPGDEVIVTLGQWLQRQLQFFTGTQFQSLLTSILPHSILIPVLLSQKLPLGLKRFYVQISLAKVPIYRPLEIADRHNLKLITDTAQAPGAIHNGYSAGTQADIGGFSLNYHKHIHCGEGGLLVTNDDHLAERLRLIRNHGEAVISSDLPSELSNILGHNFRLGEIEASIAREQLQKLPTLVASRQHAADRLSSGLASLPGLTLPHTHPLSTHVYYVYGMVLDLQLLSISRSWLVDALTAEGVPALFAGYQCIHRILYSSIALLTVLPASHGRDYQVVIALLPTMKVYAPLPKNYTVHHFLG